MTLGCMIKFGVKRHKYELWRWNVGSIYNFKNDVCSKQAVFTIKHKINISKKFGRLGMCGVWVYRQLVLFYHTNVLFFILSVLKREDIKNFILDKTNKLAFIHKAYPTLFKSLVKPWDKTIAARGLIIWLDDTFE